MYLFSNEIVFENHPDKMADRIACAILDEYLKQDPKTRAGIEVAGGKGIVFITGEVTSKGIVTDETINKIVKRIVNEESGDTKQYQVINNLGKQSLDISMGVDVGGAGDQCNCFGFACDETSRLLPKSMCILQDFSYEYTHTLFKKYPDKFRSDGKAQITGEYDDNMHLIKIKTFLVSYQNYEKDREFTDGLIKKLINKICQKYGVEVEEILINPTGRFEVGGFEGDSGVTNRKLVVDSYQSFAKIGGGGYWGKDPTKVDLSGPVKARELAIRFLGAYNLKWCEVQLSYAIGKEEPLSIYVNSDKGNIDVNFAIYQECTPRNIIEDFSLNKPIYEDWVKKGLIY